ncbi:MAG: methylmalonyl-CoA mutase subunit beta [Chlorobiaceae bacterium]
MTHIRPDALFSEFSPISRDEWKRKASSDLKDTPYESIVWHTPDGFDLEPWYSAAGKEHYLHTPLQRSTNAWKSCFLVTVTTPAEANGVALSCLKQDAGALEFSFSDSSIFTSRNLQTLFAGIEISAISIYFSGALPPAAQMIETLSSLGGFAGVSGGLMAHLKDTGIEEDRKIAGLIRSFPRFSLLSVDTTPFHEEGSTASQEIAYALAGASDLINRFLDAGLTAAEAAASMEILLPVGSSHFTELAKPRALCHLLRQILNAYGAGESTPLPRLFARTSGRNRSLLDPYTNVLRLTTEAVSAILGGYETLQLRHFDDGLSVEPEVAARITGNIHLVLKEEGLLDRVVDPARGSSYIETLTRELAVAAWDIFKQIEKSGGLAAASRNGMIRTLALTPASRREKEIAKRKKTLLGVNRYAWPLTPEQERNIGKLMDELSSTSTSSETAAFELLRLKTLSYALKHGSAPSAFIWTAGDPIVSQRQAAFCRELFSCGGFAIAGSASLPLEDGSCEKALENEPAFVVLCIAEKDPLPAAETICRTLKRLNPAIIPLMAGRPPEESEQLTLAGLEGFIYTGVNVLETLSSFQRKTGVQ